jgi:hypothetical protein
VIAIAVSKTKPGQWGIFWDPTVLVVLDRTSGRTLWTRQAKEGFHHHALAVGDGMAFLIESPSRITIDKNSPPDSTRKPADSTIMALDARSGKTRWSAVTTNQSSPHGPKNVIGIVERDDWLGYGRELKILLAGKTNEASAFDARDGKLLWCNRIGNPPIIVCGEQFLNQQGQPFDLRNGKSLGPGLIFNKGGCNYVVANPHLLLFRDQSVSYIERASQKKQSLYAIRSGCSNSLIAADGLLNAPCFSVGCVCNYPIQTSFALVPEKAENTVPAASP